MDTESSILKKKIEDCDMSTRVKNCLNVHEIFEVGQLSLLTDDEIKTWRNFGRVSLQELVGFCENNGVPFLNGAYCQEMRHLCQLNNAINSLNKLSNALAFFMEKRSMIIKRIEDLKKKIPLL